MSSDPGSDIDVLCNLTEETHPANRVHIHQADHDTDKSFLSTSVSLKMQGSRSTYQKFGMNLIRRGVSSSRRIVSIHA